jgi:teichuronic acid biosynthesis glycosyltransferase TuaC
MALCPGADCTIGTLRRSATCSADSHALRFRNRRGIPMRALWITGGYPSAGNATAFVFHQTQARALSATGVTVSIVAPTPWVPPGLDRLNPRWTSFKAAPHQQRDGAIDIHRPRYLTTPRETRYGIAHLTQAFACRHVAKPDIIHAHFAYPSGSCALALKRRFGVPLVLSVLGDDVYIYPHHSPRMMRLFVDAVRGADCVIANSPDLARTTLAQTGVRPEVLSIGVDVTRFAAGVDRAAARGRFGIPTDQFVVLFVGRLTAEKGVREFAAALRQLAWPDTTALFVGPGPERPEAPGVCLLGPRPNDEIPALLAAADLFVLPSWHEGLGESAVEAGAAGVPVVGSHTGGLADLLSDECGYTFSPKDTAALARALCEARFQPVEAKRRAARLQEKVFREHDIRANTRQLAKIYRTLGAPILADAG